MLESYGEIVPKELSSFLPLSVLISENRNHKISPFFPFLSTGLGHLFGFLLIRNSTGDQVLPAMDWIFFLVKFTYSSCKSQHDHIWTQSPWVLSCFSCVWLFETLWTVAHLAPLSMGFVKQEYWSGLKCLPPRNLPNQGLSSPLLFSCIGRPVLYHYSHPFTANPHKTNMKVLVAHLCLTLGTPSTVACQVPLVHRILQARILEWAAISFSTGSFSTMVKPRSPTLQAVSLPSELSGTAIRKY